MILYCILSNLYCNIRPSDKDAISSSHLFKLPSPVISLDSHSVKSHRVKIDDNIHRQAISIDERYTQVKSLADVLVEAFEQSVEEVLESVESGISKS